MPGHARLTAPARQDLRELRNWLAEAAGGERARRFVDRLLRHCEELSAIPQAGRVRPEFGEGVRSTVVSPYVIFYEPRSYGMRNLRIIHGNRDIDRA